MVLTEKISLNLPILHTAIIDFDLVDEGKYKSRTAFIIEAIKEKLEKEGIDLNPKEILELKDWW